MKSLLSWKTQITAVLACILAFSFNAQAADMGKVINLAGKQRMLTQKMTKELLMIASGVDVDASKENLKKTASLFGMTLDDLIANCKKPDIKAQFEVVKKTWAEYAPIIESADTTDNAVKKAESLNMILLKESNKAVKMLESSLK